MRKQRRLEESQNAREIDPRTAAIDDVTLDMIDEEPQRVKRRGIDTPDEKTGIQSLSITANGAKRIRFKPFRMSLRIALLDRLIKHYDSGVKISIVKCRPKLTLRIELQRMGTL